jgi:hypothetical protein
MWGWFEAPALAWDTVGATWPEMPIHYVVSDEPLTDDELAAIQAGFSTWEDVDCADVRFQYDGRVPDAFGVLDGQNWVGLVPANWPDEPELVSLPSLTYQGTTMEEADLALNSEWHTWVTSGADGRIRLDLQAGVAHEVGHLLGLWHSTVPEATMNPVTAGSPDAETLEQDDLDGICSLYPKGVGGGGLGDACTQTPDCADELQCVADADASYCAPACDGPNEECPDGYTCLDAGGQQVCAQDVGCGCESGAIGSAWVAGLVALAVARRRGR